MADKKGEETISKLGKIARRMKYWCIRIFKGRFAANEYYASKFLERTTLIGFDMPPSPMEPEGNAHNFHWVINMGPETVQAVSRRIDLEGYAFVINPRPLPARSFVQTEYLMPLEPLPGVFKWKIRHCWRCGMTLDYTQACSKSGMILSDFRKVWESENVEFLCCGCLPKVSDQVTGRIPPWVYAGT